MREIFYAVYKKSNYPILIYTSLAEAISRGEGRFFKDRFILRKDAINFYSNERQVLNKIYLNKRSNFHFPDYFDWLKTIEEECFKKEYVQKSWFRTKFTDEFKNEINNNMKNGFNKEIIEFINTSDIKKIKNIIEDVKDNVV